MQGLTFRYFSFSNIIQQTHLKHPAGRLEHRLVGKHRGGVFQDHLADIDLKRVGRHHLQLDIFILQAVLDGVKRILPNADVRFIVTPNRHKTADAGDTKVPYQVVCANVDKS